VTGDPRIPLVEDAFEAFQSRDLERVAGFLHPEVESHVAPPLMNAGTWQGAGGFLEMTAGWEEAFGSVRYEIRRFELLDEHNLLVDVHQEAVGAGSGVPVALDVIFLIEMVDERAVRFQIHPDREKALAAV
jgi:ketosteroid isomerase-like protein